VTGPRVALATYSTRPRGGVVHTLRLAESLHAIGERVHIFALGRPGDGSSWRVPHTIVAAPPRAGTLTERVYAAADALADPLRDAAPGLDVIHAQDCVAARAALEVRAARPDVVVARTVHHVDDFTTPALIECQRRSIMEPDHVLVVSDFWRRALRRDVGVEATVVTNGVDAARFALPPKQVPAHGRFLFLTVGGVEPRKGSIHLVEAWARLRARIDPPPLLAVVGGHSFQDHAPYREAVMRRAAELGLRLGVDLHLVGTVGDEELVAWYHAADAFVFPSVNEGWGLAVLEALAAGLPVIATSIPVFHEYLRHGHDALLVQPRDPVALAGAMEAVVTNRALRHGLAAAGPRTAARFTWEATARHHATLYRMMLGAQEAAS
jgi:glycosyltransferase-like protein